MVGPEVKKTSVFIVISIGAVGMGWWLDEPDPTLLSLRIGQHYDEVVKGSTYPVVNGYGNPHDDESGAGWTFIDKPAVVIEFNDPQHGFLLPPTKFASVAYEREKVSSLTTSPMLEALPFEETVDMVERLQVQFRRRGWTPWQEDGSDWFDTSPAGRRRLSEQLAADYAVMNRLQIPGRYWMSVTIKCALHCGETQEAARFLIDIGVISDPGISNSRLGNRGRDILAGSTLLASCGVGVDGAREVKLISQSEADGQYSFHLQDGSNNKRPLFDMDDAIGDAVHSNCVGNTVRVLNVFLPGKMKRGVLVYDDPVLKKLTKLEWTNETAPQYIYVAKDAVIMAFSGAAMPTPHTLRYFFYRINAGNDTTFQYWESDELAPGTGFQVFKPSGNPDAP